MLDEPPVRPIIAWCSTGFVKPCNDGRGLLAVGHPSVPTLSKPAVLLGRIPVSWLGDLGSK